MCEKYAKNIVFKLNPFIQNKSFHVNILYDFSCKNHVYLSMNINKYYSHENLTRKKGPPCNIFNQQVLQWVLGHDTDGGPAFSISDRNPHLDYFLF